MSNAPANPTSGHEWGQSSILLAFCPNLRDRYSFLLKVLQRLAPTLRENPKWKRHHLEQHLCNQAMLEEAGRSPGDLFRGFLPWAPKLMPLIAEKLEDLRGVHHGPLALEIIAKSLGTTAAIVTGVMYPSGAKPIRQIPPKEMRGLILTSQNGADRVVAQPQQPQLEASKPKKDPGRHKAAAEKTRYFEVGTAVEREIPTFNRLFEAKKATPASAKLLSLGFTQQQIDAALRSNTPTIAARRFISYTYLVKGKDKFLDYDTVKKYHQRFLSRGYRVQKLPPSSCTHPPGTEIEILKLSRLSRKT
jgi:hypothetical protein